MEKTKKAASKENNVKPFKTIDLSEVERGKLQAAVARVQMAENNLVEERNKQADLLALIYDHHGIDGAKVIKVHLEGEQLIVYDG